MTRTRWSAAIGVEYETKHGPDDRGSRTTRRIEKLETQKSGGAASTRTWIVTFVLQTLVVSPSVLLDFACEFRDPVVLKGWSRLWPT